MKTLSAMQFKKEICKDEKPLPRREVDQKAKLELEAYKFTKSWDEQVKIARTYFDG